jgi:hypothetical protein
MRRLALIVVLSLGPLAYAADLHVPERIVAGNSLAIPTSGSGGATFYLVGPAGSSKRRVQLGREIQIAPDELRAAGRYVALVKDDRGTQSATFFVVPAAPGRLSFLARPSRVPADAKGAIVGTAFVFDKYDNLVLQPAKVRFDLAVPGMPPQARTVASKDGVAWTRMDSARKAGAAQFVASVGDSDVRRVVQQVASDPCNLRLKAAPAKGGILVQTDPVRDCAGNPVPDGTIVTFTSVDAAGRKSTVDARIKRGFAEALLPNTPQATISVASGVVVGNEIHWRGAGE